LARKILLADDSVTAQNMGRKILADAGYEVITVNNGSAALKRVSEQRPDLIVLDVYMPGYSGLEVCQRLKEAGDTAQIPVLLTVGKLEPFKPEEAKRVRADAFIVKPFEASELLSALSKLEDKVVPRSESAKPGRFSRSSSHSLDDSRYDKTMAVEEDTSWKNRIVFPSKKKSDEPSEVEDPAVYGAANKTVRPAVQARTEMPVAKVEPAAKVEEERVDLGALSAAGLPKDVTPEEIAALAAAAARVKSAKESAAEMPVVAPTEAESPKPEVPVEAVVELSPVAASSISTPASEANPEPKTATIEPEPVPVSQADAIAAVAEQRPPAAAEEPVTTAQSGSSSATPLNEPVTMAMAAAASASSASSRWTAVSVAVAPEDATISLEQEMQKAYAAFAAAEVAHNVDMSGSAAGNGNGLVAEASEPAIAVQASVAPAVAQTMSEVATAATDAVRAAVQELESIAASYVAASPSESTNSCAGQTEIVPAKEEEKTPEPVNGKSSTVEEAVAAQAGPTPEVSAQSSEASPVSSHESPSSADIPGSPSGDAPSSQDQAAMAVAAGAEASPPEPAPESESQSQSESSIDSIVESVLADLRPKIVAEISKKLGKRK